MNGLILEVVLNDGCGMWAVWSDAMLSTWGFSGAGARISSENAIQERLPRPGMESEHRAHLVDTRATGEKCGRRWSLVGCGYDSCSAGDNQFSHWNPAYKRGYVRGMLEYNHEVTVCSILWLSPSPNLMPTLQRIRYWGNLPEKHGFNGRIQGKKYYI